MTKEPEEPKVSGAKLRGHAAWMYFNKDTQDFYTCGSWDTPLIYFTKPPKHHGYKLRHRSQQNLELTRVLVIREED